MSYLVSDAKLIQVHRIIATSARLADFSRGRQIATNEHLSDFPLVCSRYRQTSIRLNFKAEAPAAIFSIKYYICAMAKIYFKRYIWLVDLINRRGPISFRDISDAWSGRGGAGTCAKRTTLCGWSLSLPKRTRLAQEPYNKG